MTNKVNKNGASISRLCSYIKWPFGLCDWQCAQLIFTLGRHGENKSSANDNDRATSTRQGQEEHYWEHTMREKRMWCALVINK